MIYVTNRVTLIKLKISIEQCDANNQLPVNMSTSKYHYCSIVGGQAGPLMETKYSVIEM